VRYKFAEILLKQAKKDNKIILMTGDLGAHLFEPLREELGDRFINAGVAEHNMVTAAAGMAYVGFKPWIYSIAPFVTIKVLEEIRNDICLHNYNVKMVGLGGGYDYAIAGPTHHVLNDVALMMTLPHIKIYTPGFSEDLEGIVHKMSKENFPAYLRLTKAEKLDFSLSSYSGVRRLSKGKKLTVVVLGSIINRVIPAIIKFPKEIVDVWLVSEFPLRIPIELLQSIRKTKTVCVIEEHVQTGGLGHHFNHILRENKISFKHFVHLYAKGYISQRYGSRDFYLKESGLDKESIKKVIESLV